jgi:hypothetical protein
MQTLTETQIYTYTIEQLIDLAQDNAVERIKQWWYEHGAEYDWWECMYEDFKREGYELGFVIDDINFTGFYSQGDGACWSGQVDVARWLKTHTLDSIGREAWLVLIEEGFCDKHFGISFGGHYSHSNTMRCIGWDWLSDDLSDEHNPNHYLQQDNIFKGMPYKELQNLIKSSDYPYTDPNDIEEAAFESAKDYADEIYKRLREEHEYIMSEANLIEMCNINEWKFNKEGEMV